MMNTYSDRYRKNDVMELIGAQEMEPLVDGGYDDLKWIAKAYGIDRPPHIMWDAFQLGIIYGKRAERTRRKSASR